MINPPRYKTEKTASLVKNLVAEFLGRESAGPALITVTDMKVSNNRKNSLVFISVFPRDHEKRVLDFAMRKRTEITKYVREKSKMRAVPHLEFVIDEGEKNRQRVDELLHEEERRQ